MNKIPSNKIKRVVIWGLKNKYHTHRHIHQAFYKNAKKLCYPVLWIEDEKRNQKYIQPGDLIITADAVGKMVPEKTKFEEYNIPIRDDIFYCLHNIKDIFKNKLNQKNYINLQVYNEEVLPSNKDTLEKWNEVVFFDNLTKTLYQPWGTDLLPDEFKEPTYNKNKFIFWVGSIWNDKNNHGNLNEITELKNVLNKNKISFINLRFIPDFLNIFFIRISRIAPAIGGNFQSKVNYLPCRMFKNISYGHLGITNIKKFKDILEDSYVDGKTITEIIERGLSFPRQEYIQLVKKQQEFIKKYTYERSLINIFNAFDKIK